MLNLFEKERSHSFVSKGGILIYIQGKTLFIHFPQCVPIDMCKAIEVDIFNYCARWYLAGSFNKSKDKGRLLDIEFRVEHERVHVYSKLVGIIEEVYKSKNINRLHKAEINILSPSYIPGKKNIVYHKWNNLC